jgi:hypothetical protein
MPHAEYALVEAGAAGVNVRLHRVALDGAALRASAQDSDNPLAPSLLQEWS